MHGGGWMQGSPETHDEIAAFTGVGVLVAEDDRAEQEDAAERVTLTRHAEDAAIGQARRVAVLPGAVVIGGGSVGGQQLLPVVRGGFGEMRHHRILE